jgi:hypothetical protein
MPSGEIAIGTKIGFDSLGLRLISIKIVNDSNLDFSL